MSSKWLANIFPKYLRKFLLKLAVLMLMFSLCRILFYGFNKHHFTNVSFLDFMAGWWFDLIAALLLFYPLILVELFPNKNRKRKFFKWATAFLTALAFFLGILINLIDVEYFAHSSSRSGSALFTMLGFGSDLSQQLPSYIKDYWILFVLFFVFLGASYFLLKKIYKRTDDSPQQGMLKQSIIYVVVIATALIVGRGGFGLRPISPADAAKYTSSENMQLVLNSAFKVINTLGIPQVEEKDYFTEQELSKIYNPTRQYDGVAELQDQNICIIILESFTPEFIDVLNDDDAKFTPFFDSLSQEGMLFTNCFANGKKSIDAMPSIIGSIPKLMDTEYMTSYYNGNSIDGLPNILAREKGYSTAFFHGATNGSMAFNSFCDLAGFEHYYGRTEYNNEEHFDGTWGIFDEEFLAWSVDQMTAMKKPFFSTLFTISSHAPYAIPERYQDRFKGGPSKMHDAVMYADYALAQFFQKAQQESWFNETLFIITADHTPASNRKEYLTNYGIVNIPLLLYHPTDTTFTGINDRIVAQIDIAPTVLDLVGYQQPFFAFGQSIFGNEIAGTAYNLADKYVFIGSYQKKKYTLSFQADQSTALYAFEDTYEKENLIASRPAVAAYLEKRLKAFIQTYNAALLNNEMKINE